MTVRRDNSGIDIGGILFVVIVIAVLSSLGHNNRPDPQYQSELREWASRRHGLLIGDSTPYMRVHDIWPDSILTQGGLGDSTDTADH